MLLREVYGWLRYQLGHDAICVLNGIVVEDLPSSQNSNQNDQTDGCRTLFIYSKSKGLTPRIEVRFTYPSPQVWFIPLEGKDQLIANPSSLNFPFWRRSDFVNYLILLAQAKLCSDMKSLLQFVSLTCPETDADEKEITANVPKMEFDIVKRVIDTAKKAKEKDTQFNQEIANKQLKARGFGNIDDFKNAVIEYTKKKKLDWDDLKWLQDEIEPKGKPVIPLRVFKTNFFDDPKYKGIFPANIQDKLEEINAEYLPFNHIKEKLENIVASRREGKDVYKEVENIDKVEFGMSVAHYLNKGELPLPYIALMEKCDPRERILPWSYIRRKTIAYKTEAFSVTNSLEDAIIAWLNKSNLMEALYQITERDSRTVSELVKKSIQKRSEQTIYSEEWVNKLLLSLSHYVSPLDVKKELQIEFDMWLLDTLNLSVNYSKIPLSPHAFSTESKNEELYHKIFDLWTQKVKETSHNRKTKSIKALSLALQEFYGYVVKELNKDLANYKPKVPSVKDITDAAKKDKTSLLNVLLKDIEEEIGSTLTEDSKNKLLSCPFFNTIYNEVRFQGVKL